MTYDELCRVVRDVLSPERFYAKADANVRLVHRPPKPMRFEVFQGQLLGPNQTRQERELESYDVIIERQAVAEGTAGPVVSVEIDAAEGVIFVTRGLRTRQWEPYEAEPNVILTRQIEGPARELIGRINLARVTARESFGRELRELVFQAVVGSSRLPITSLESPLPDYSLGRLAYLPAPTTPDASLGVDIDALLCHAISAELTVRQQTKLVEAALRAAQAEDIPWLGDRLIELCRDSAAVPRRADEILRRVFNDAALSPYTDFANKFVALLRHLSAPQGLGPSTVIDTISYMLRQIVRHLTAFDLVTFHNLGANFPDALLLDSLLCEYLRLAEQHSEQFSATGGRHGVRRRRALRQAWIVRKWYENHPVPDRPTSPGDQERVLPEPFRPVPDEQLTQPSKRRRRLFDDLAAEDLFTPITRRIFEASLADLSRDAELRELGTALFLDRPLGVFKPPGAVDRTPLLSYEAFSQHIARRRLDALLRWDVLGNWQSQDDCIRRLEAIAPEGFPASQLPGTDRGGVVAAEDAHRAAIDFRFRRTTRSSLDEFFGGYDLEPLKRAAPKLAQWLTNDRQVLLIRTLPKNVEMGTAEPGDQRFTALDRDWRPRIELAPLRNADGSVRYFESAGVELLEEGLVVTALWNVDAPSDQTAPRRLEEEPIRLLPRPG